MPFPMKQSREHPDLRQIFSSIIWAEDAGTQKSRCLRLTRRCTVNKNNTGPTATWQMQQQGPHFSTTTAELSCTSPPRCDERKALGMTDRIIHPTHRPQNRSHFPLPRCFRCRCRYRCHYRYRCHLPRYCCFRWPFQPPVWQRKRMDDDVEGSMLLVTTGPRCMILRYR